MKGLINKEPFFSVSDATKMISSLFDSSQLMRSITIKGELSNFVAHRSGHCYFSLKDENAAISCVMFRSKNIFLDFEPENGMEVKVIGRIGIYAARGTYQLYAEKMENFGSGDLFQKFELLKKNLSKEGLFDKNIKKKIPKFPQTIGIVTSLTAAALQDILNVIKRRYANLNIIISPSQVQGKTASKTIISAIDKLERYKNIDIMIISRGGGSYEDLFVFNDEQLARKIYSCDIPVITGIGHEIDFTIADFVADLRAPTPSAAAELATAEFKSILDKIEKFKLRIYQSTQRIIQQNKKYLSLFSKDRLSSIIEREIEKYYQSIDDNYSKLNNIITSNIDSKKVKLDNIKNSLELLHPHKTLERGFILAEKNGKRILTKNSLVKDDLVNLKFSDGEVKTKVI